MTQQPHSAFGDSSLEGLLGLFDVAQSADGVYTAESAAGSRMVVEGSQVLAQSIVAAGKALPGRTVRTAHSLFVGVNRPDKPIELAVEVIRAGRSFASAVVSARQDGRVTVTTTVLLDSPLPDLIRHDHPAGTAESGPGDAYPSSLALPGRDVRIAGVRDVNDPAEVGPPTLDAWLRYTPVPDRDDLRRALLAYFTGHLAISTTFRAHHGVGTAQSHHTVGTAPMGIGVTFHEPASWDGWIRYHHESTYVGAGMSYVRGQVLTADGRLVASFTQDAMIKALDAAGTEGQIPPESRL